MLRFLIALSCFLGVPLTAWAADITGLELTRAGAGEHIRLHLEHLDEAAAPPVWFIAETPPRLVIDVQRGKLHGTLALPAQYQSTLITKIRAGQHDATHLRLVLELAQSAQLSGLTWRAGKHAAWQEATLSPQATKHALPVIVIDAGHGGQDPGTQGLSGTLEKTLTLRYAKHLRDLLQQSGAYRVVLTREDDRYLLLQDRVKRARDAGGALFISLHADSAPTPLARGLSIYTISDIASDKQTAALAAKENKADILGGIDLSSASPEVANILIDLAERETRGKSEAFANMLVKLLRSHVTLLTHPHRSAGFAVLKAPDIPSVLIEIGFITHPKEEKLLLNPVHETTLVRAVAEAVDRYFKVGR